MLRTSSQCLPVAEGFSPHVKMRQAPDRSEKLCVRSKATQIWWLSEALPSAVQNGIFGHSCAQVWKVKFWWSESGLSYLVGEWSGISANNGAEFSKLDPFSLNHVNPFYQHYQKGCPLISNVIVVSSLFDFQNLCGIFSHAMICAKLPCKRQ